MFGAGLRTANKLCSTIMLPVLTLALTVSLALAFLQAEPGRTDTPKDALASTKTARELRCAARVQLISRKEDKRGLQNIRF